MLRIIARMYLWFIGWRVEGAMPDRHTRVVLIAAPHTSNWDYPITMACFFALGLRVRFFAKKSLFRFPLGILMRATGGIPVDRSKSNNLVDAAVQTFAAGTPLILIVPVEGTRGYVQEWKSGFYHIAQGAGVAILPAYLDYKRKRGGFFPLFTPTGDYTADVSALRALYRNVTPRHPNLSNLNQA